MIRHRITLPLALAAAAVQLPAQVDLVLAGKVDLPGGGEIIAYTKDNYTLATTYFTGGGSAETQGVNLYSFTGAGATWRATADLSGVFGADQTYSVSSVALDPLGRGFGVATVIPTANTTVASRLAFFDYQTGAVLHAVDVGYHADSVTFSRDGTRLVVANEGEANTGSSAAGDGSDAAGSLSIVSLGGISQASEVTGLTAVTKDFSAANLAAGVTLAGLRNSYLPSLGNPGNSAGQQALNTRVPDFNAPENISHLGVEPEYSVVHNGKVYVSLQENNAVAVYDLATGAWEKIHQLGTIAQTIDASDQAGVGAFDQVVRGLPMPDTLSVVTIAGTDYIITANEGDARIDDRDAGRFGDVSGADALTPLLDPSLPATQTGIRANDQLGRLNISRIDGDLDGDGDIDVPTMFGTRSFSIWNAETGALVGDSGNLDQLLFALDPSRHGINRDNLTVDNRSDDKGSEPEALSVFSLGNLTYAAVGLERQNGILLFDITDPTRPRYVDYLNGLDFGLISPESLLYIAAEDSPTGISYLLGGFEGEDDRGANAGIGIFAATPVPEPATFGVVAALALAGMALWRRRR